MRLTLYRSIHSSAQRCRTLAVCPLPFIAGDKEVLRDEIIYACVFFSIYFQLIDVSCRAHRAAHPERFLVRDEAKDMYPAPKNVEKLTRPTPVHLQVYDGMSALCHALRS
jgi:hypothetical protein